MMPKTVHWLDIGPSFLNADGTLKRDLMPDALHPNPEGYRVWAVAMKPTARKTHGRQVTEANPVDGMRRGSAEEFHGRPCVDGNSRQDVNGEGHT